MGYEVKATKGTFTAEVAADAKYDFVKLNAYFVNNVKVNKDKDIPSKATKNLLNAKLAFDFASFEVPATLSVEMIDAVNKERTLGVNVGYTIVKGLKVGLGYNTTLVEKPVWDIKGDVAYTIENIALLKAAIQYKSANKLIITASAENTTLINGATLALAYSGNKINLKDTKASTIGKVVASCKIAF